MKIGLDLDGVVCDYHAVLLRELNYMQHTRFRPEEINNPDFNQLGLSREEVWDVVKLHAKSRIFRYLKPVEGAIKGVNKLYENHSIHVITHRLGRAREDAVYWLYGHGIPFDSISFSNKKGKYARLLDVKVMIDDMSRNARNLSNYGIKVLLFDKPHNRHVKNTSLIQRVHNWKQINNILK